QRIKGVIKEIKLKENELFAKSSGLKESVIDLRKGFWEDVTVNIEDPDDAIETEASIKQQAELLIERERTHGHISEELNTLDRLNETAHDARIDEKDDTRSLNENVYIDTASGIAQAVVNYLNDDCLHPSSAE